METIINTDGYKKTSTSNSTMTNTDYSTYDNTTLPTITFYSDTCPLHPLI